MRQNPLDSYLNLHKRANQFTTPAYFKRGIISAIHIQQGTADVQIVGNQNTTLKNIPLSSAIATSLALVSTQASNPNIQVGDKCLLFMFDETNPNDCVVVCAYGRKFQ